MARLLPSSGLLEGGKGVRVKGGLGDNSSRDVSQLPTLRMQRKTGRGAVLPQKVLMCYGRVCSSLTELLMGHCAVPGGAKLDSSVGGQSPKNKLTKCGIYGKVCGLKDEPLRTATSNLKTVFVTFANTYFPPQVLRSLMNPRGRHSPMAGRPSVFPTA